MFPNIEAERANRLDISYSTMRNWMQGVTEIPSSKLVEMARLFHCTTDYLLGFTYDGSAEKLLCGRGGQLQQKGERRDDG